MKSSLLFGLAVVLHAADLPPLVHVAAPGVFYRQSEDEKKIIATTSWIEFRDFLVVIDANYPWGARAIVPDIRKNNAEAGPLCPRHSLPCRPQLWERCICRNGRYYRQF